jgi:polyhydroxyalkanoate synthesis repressor PhaR
MGPLAQQTIIKRLSNRRLYNTRARKFVSRKHLDEMARKEEDFVVIDAPTGENITRLVLGQIILARETEQSQPLLPADFSRQLMDFYGDTLRTLLACYLEFSLLTFTSEGMRKQMMQAGNSVLNLMDKQVQQNIKFFEAILADFASKSETDHTKTEGSH